MKRILREIYYRISIFIGILSLLIGTTGLTANFKDQAQELPLQKIEISQLDKEKDQNIF